MWWPQSGPWRATVEQTLTGLRRTSVRSDPIKPTSVASCSGHLNASLSNTASALSKKKKKHQLTQTEPNPNLAEAVTACRYRQAEPTRHEPPRGGSRRELARAVTAGPSPSLGGLRLDFGLGGSATPPLDASLRSVADSAPNPTACCYFPPAGEKAAAAAASDASPEPLLPRRSARRKVLEKEGDDAMAEEKESTSVPLSQAAEAVDPEDPAKSPPRPSSPTTSTRKACCAVLQSWVSRKFMTGCVVLFPVAFTFFITWWFVQFVDGFFSPLYAKIGVDIFGLGFLTSLAFIFLVGIFVSSWVGSTVFWVGEWFIKKMPFVKHIYSASKQVSTAISPDQNTTAFKEVAIIRHPRVGEYAFGFITSTVVLQTDKDQTYPFEKELKLSFLEE
ncbi:hypothetical protein ZWY2020_030750 [Hordeum vulgare]|nr:hypothetical protein ZWY2020_030750 [Hordeum vulgare]